MSDTGKEGIRAEISIGSPPDCPIAEVSEKYDVPSRSVSKTSLINSPVVTEEVMFDSESSLEEDETEDEMEKVFSYGSKSVYRFSREQSRGCACERVEELGCPVIDTYTRDDELFLVFHTPDTETLKQVISSLDEHYSDIEVEKLVRSKKDSRDDRLVFVDRSELTERQEEVLRKAHSMGYFEHPKGANAGEVADELGISASAFTEHLAAAQKKIMLAVLSS